MSIDDALVMILAGGEGKRLLPLTKDRADHQVYDVRKNHDDRKEQLCMCYLPISYQLPQKFNHIQSNL